MAENTEKLVTLSNLSDHIEEIKRILKQVRAYIDKKDTTKVDKVSGKGLSTNDLTTELLNKLNSLENYDDTAVRNLIKGISSRIDTLVGESASEAIDNFNEILAFLNGVTDTQTLQGLLLNLKAEFEGLMANKVDKVSGKQLSTNDYTTAEKTKLSGIEEGAQKNTVTGVKGNAETSYRTGDVNLTPADIGAAAASHTHKMSEITDLSIPTYETLTLTVTAEDGSSVAGQKATINGDVYPLDSTGIVIANIPFGVEYTIELDAKSNYIVPAPMTFMSSQNSREVTITYKEKQLGVFIQDKSHRLWNVSEWNTSNNSNVNGVVLVTENVELLISLTETSKLQVVESYANLQYLSDINPITDDTVARYDFNGKSKTEKIIKINSSIDYSPGYCWNFVFPDGITHGYLPSMGEYNEIYQNIGTISTALSKVGGRAFHLELMSFYQSSTLYGVNSNNRIRFCLLNFNNGLSVMCPEAEDPRLFRVVAKLN